MMLNMMGDWDGGMMRRWDGNMMGWGGWGLGIIFNIVVWVVIIIAIVALVRWLMAEGKTYHPRQNTALDILKERYAKGEITKEEFESKKKDVQ